MTHIPTLTPELLKLRESSAPSAEAGTGQLYVEAGGKLLYKDGAGTVLDTSPLLREGVFNHVADTFDVSFAATSKRRQRREATGAVLIDGTGYTAGVDVSIEVKNTTGATIDVTVLAAWTFGGAVITELPAGSTLLIACLCTETTAASVQAAMFLGGVAFSPDADFNRVDATQDILAAARFVNILIPDPGTYRVSIRAYIDTDGVDGSNYGEAHIVTDEEVLGEAHVRLGTASASGSSVDGTLVIDGPTTEFLIAFVAENDMLCLEVDALITTTVATEFGVRLRVGLGTPTQLDLLRGAVAYSMRVPSGGSLGGPVPAVEPSSFPLTIDGPQAGLPSWFVIGGATGGLAGIAGRSYVIPFYVGERISITHVETQVTTEAVGGLIDVAIWECTKQAGAPGFVPTTRVYYLPNQDGSALGVFSYTTGLPLTVDQGLYAVVLTVNNTITLARMTVNAPGWPSFRLGVSSTQLLQGFFADTGFPAPTTWVTAVSTSTANGAIGYRPQASIVWTRP